MGRGSRIAAAAAGVLCANALEHLATAAVSGRMLTPLAGHDSSPAVNALWGGMNLVGGLVLIRVCSRKVASRGRVPEAFGIGAAASATWAVVGERMFEFNSPAR